MTRTQRFARIVSLIRDPGIGCRLTDQQWEDVIHILREADLLGTLYYLAERDRVIATYCAFAQRHLKSMKVYSDRQARQVDYECALINQQLRDEGIVPFFLKGAGYTLRRSFNARGRIYSDIDVLVARHEIEPAQRIFRTNGWYTPPISDYDKRYYRRWAHEVPPMRHLTRRTVIDLHHNIVPPISGRAPNIAQLCRNPVITQRGLSVLSAPAAFLHSLVHLFSNEDLSKGFRDLVDLYLLLEEYANSDFWNALLVLVEETGFMQELLYALLLLERILGWSLPAAMETRLREPMRRTGAGFTVTRVLGPAMRPHHPQVCGATENLAIQLAYIRGHWIKMPLPVLLGHLSIKAGMAVGQKMFGKYKAAATLEQAKE